MGFYNPYGYYSPQQQQVQQNTQPQPQMQIQNGGFVVVRSEQEVYNYPISLGSCITFKIEGQPIVMEKIMGFSQLEAPRIKRYRLVEEEVQNEPQKSAETETFDAKDINTTIDSLKAEIKAIYGEIEGIKDKLKPTQKATNKKAKEEAVEDDT